MGRQGFGRLDSGLQVYRRVVGVVAKHLGNPFSRLELALDERPGSARRFGRRHGFAVLEGPVVDVQLFHYLHRLVLRLGILHGTVFLPFTDDKGRGLVPSLLTQAAFCSSCLMRSRISSTVSAARMAISHPG